jgi:hypothetical protein
MGIFAVRNQATGRVSVKASRNVPGAINRLTFELRQGCHRDRSLQALWHARGADGVTMDVLERVCERQDPAFDDDAGGGRLSARQRCGRHAPAGLLRQALPMEKIGLVQREREGGGATQLVLAAGGARRLRDACDTARTLLATPSAPSGQAWAR